jgi:hypothetical protein
MNIKNVKLGFALFLSLLFMTSSAFSQDKSQRPSPPDSAHGKIGNAMVSVSYGSPSVKGRKIWGGLVPYDKAWRLGANEATIFTTDKPIKVEGKELPAGKYSLFAIPTEKEWQIIFNSQTGQWGIKRTGEANYDPANNVLVVNVKPKKSAQMNERLKYEIHNNGMVIRWENLEVPVSIR